MRATAAFPGDRGDSKAPRSPWKCGRHLACPQGGEIRATVNPRTNLAHGFCCQQNLNKIDLLMTLEYDFRSAVALLERWLQAHEARQRSRSVR